MLVRPHEIMCGAGDAGGRLRIWLASSWVVTTREEMMTYCDFMTDITALAAY